MGFISDIKRAATNAYDRATKAVSDTASEAKKVAQTAVHTAGEAIGEVKAKATEVAGEAKAKAKQTLSAAEEEVSGLRSSFDKAVSQAKQAVTTGAATAAIDVGALKKANPGTIAGIDEEAIGADLAKKAADDPAGVAQAIGELDSSDRDDVSEELAKNLSNDQLAKLASTPDGRKLLEKMRYELDDGPTWPGEQAQIDRIDRALKNAKAAAAKPADAAPAIPPEKQAASGAEYDQTRPKVSDSTPLPGDSKEILKNLTQLNGQGDGSQRCGSTALIAGAIAKEGPQGAANLAKKLAADARKNGDRNNAAIYEDIAKQLSNPKTATYGQLGRLSETIFNANAAGDAMDAKDLSRLEGVAGNQPPTVHLNPGEIPETYNVVDRLQPGESWPAKVAIGGSAEGNHWIQVGKDKDGRPFVYDPMPKNGEPQIIYRDENPQAFAKYQGAMFPDAKKTRGYANTD